jgi:hypothetical protein
LRPEHTHGAQLAIGISYLVFGGGPLWSSDVSKGLRGSNAGLILSKNLLAAKTPDAYLLGRWP